MKAHPLFHVLKAVFAFTLFALAYYAPFVLDTSGFRVIDSPVSAQLSRASAVPAIQIELLRNALGHLLPLMLCYASVAWLAGRMATTLGLKTGVARLLLLAAAWLVLVHGNGMLFPLSNYSVAFDTGARPALTTLGALVLLVSMAVALPPVLPSRRVASIVVLTGIVGFSLDASLWNDTTHANNTPTRNIIIIGIDSLSDQMASSASDQLPHLTDLLGTAKRFSHAYTPLARTFPAWTSLLSGRSPAQHGAVFNLRSMDRIQSQDLVTQTLGAAGYQRVFAMDERRFANIDESFGFDQVVGPSAGALDFVLQRINDTPLTNLLLQTRVARHFLPFSYLNVASTANYDAKGFVDETLAAIDAIGPLFLAVHFETAHFPFKTRHAIGNPGDDPSFLAKHKSALAVVDAQIGRLILGLRTSGRLRDALVIVLSDHGESLGELEASTTRAGKPFEIANYGHGADLLSEHQNRIVLGLVHFVDGQAAEPASVHDDQVSLTDLRAVIERYARGGEVTLEVHQPCIMVETGLRFKSTASYEGLDVANVANEAAVDYDIDLKGRMRLREDRLPGLVDAKDIGWRCRDRLTVYSSIEHRYFAYKLHAEGERLIETEPADEDINRISAYREELRRAVGG